MHMPGRLILVCILMGAAAARAEDWPIFRGPTRDGVSAENKLDARLAGRAEAAF